MSPPLLPRRPIRVRSVRVPTRRARRSVHLLLALVVSAGFLCGRGGAADAGGGLGDSVFSVDFFGRCGALSVCTPPGCVEDPCASYVGTIRMCEIACFVRPLCASAESVLGYSMQ